MSDDFYTQSARQRLERIEAERAAAQADLQSHRVNGDYESAGYAIQQLADLAAQQQSLTTLYNNYVASQQPRYDTASPESRAQRRPEEMTAQDMADVMNTSRYKGRGFSAQDYYNLRSG